MHEAGRRTRSSATSGGSSTRCLQMVVYVVFITIIARGSASRLPALHLRRDPALEVVQRRSSRTPRTPVVRHDRLIKQIAFPKIVLPVSATTAGVVGFVFGLIPLGPADAASTSTGSARTSCSSRSSRASSSCSRWASRILIGRRKRLLPRPRQRRRATSCGCGGTSRRASIRCDASRRSPLYPRQPGRFAPSLEANPFAILFEAYRAVIYGTPSRSADAAGLDRPAASCSRVSVAPARRSRSSSSSVSSRTSRRSFDRGRGRHRGAPPLIRTGRRTRSTPTTWASATTCGSRRRRRSATRSGRCSARGPRQHFWALRHVSLRVVHGESLAVIGPNGAGKSTLLQVLAGIIRPSEGMVDVRGPRVRAPHAGRRVRRRAVRPREHPARRGVPGPRRSRCTRELLPSIVEFADLGRVHRRAAQDLFVGHARSARVRDRHVGRPGHPPARRGPRHRRRHLPRESRRRESSSSSRRPRPSSWSPTT